MSKTISLSDFSWQRLKRPIIGLAPMDGVTDYAYRFIQKKYGQPTVMFTEFVNVEGLCHGAFKLMSHFIYNLNSAVGVKEMVAQRKRETQDQQPWSERPIIAQLYGKTPDCFYQATLLVASMGFDGVDINMGCPAKNVANHGAGAGLIQTPNLATRIIQATRQAALDWRAGATLDRAPDIEENIKLIAQKIKQLAEVTASSFNSQQEQASTRYQPQRMLLRQRQLLPVSVKTRIGYDKPITEQWIGHLLTTKIDALSVHGRTLKQAYSGQANWQEIAHAAQLARQAKVVFLGNGDIDSFETAQKKINRYNLDGVLIGRASFGNPFVFKPKKLQTNKNPLEIALEHAFLYEKLVRLDQTLIDEITATKQIRRRSETQLFLPMRKHLAWYVKNMPHAKQLRMKLMRTNSANEVREILRLER